MASDKTIITLCGFSGVGKTTIGGLFFWRWDSDADEDSSKPHLMFCDLDAYIEKRMHCSIKQFFDNHSEEEFRLLEHTALLRLIEKFKSSDYAGYRHFIISLGGGTLNLPQTRELIKNETICIYLKCSVEELAKRVGDESEIAKRPILASAVKREKSSGSADKSEAVKKRIAELLPERERYYRECSVGVIDTTHWDEDKILSDLERIIVSFLPK